MRSGLVALVIVLGAAAVWLVVFGAGRQQVQVGVLLGLWAALIAAFLLVGNRGGDIEFTADLEDARARASELHEAQLKVVAQQQEQLEAARQAYFSQEIELRQFSELQLARDASARRESEQGLQLALRGEVERVLADQLSSLRQEVASLRAEVVDKLGGQLRLERIETTRVIGSDLEALQHEIRRLAAARQDSLTAAPRSPAEPERAGRIVEAEPQVSRVGTAEPPPISRVAAEPQRVARVPDAEPQWAARVPDAEPQRISWASDTEPQRAGRVFDAGPERPARMPEAAPQRASRLPDAELVEFPPPAPELPTAPAGSARPPARDSADPFASLPRLSPVQPDLGLIPDPAPAADRSEPRQGRRRAPEPEDEGSRYQGRRRAGGAHANWLASFDG
ncbi:hypothetical protein [Jatrophihabitans sp.]|uniref:hypothetical protein n=1 Tax=Jatrophihabitans sp. TaxID=1932789 RepID=UPI002B581FC2|nr:hypothetical protein [Jatrophihabitans sp.]